MDDYISQSKNTGSSAFGSSGSGSGSGSSGSGSGSSTGWFSNFFNLTIQKMAILLAGIALVISTITVAILLWKSKNSQKWPPEISRCPDRFKLDSGGTTCSDPFGLYSGGTIASNIDNCANYTTIQNSKYANNLSAGYIPWEGVLDGERSRSSSLKC
jgi:hypothetical protein